jgi:Xaa-Pro aminopeptidase
VHEEPRLGPKGQEILKSGMAVTVEPGIYLEGKFGVRIEDLVFVTSKGHENLYRTSKELAVV